MTKTTGKTSYPPTPQIKSVLHGLRASGMALGSVIIHADGRIEVNQSSAEPSVAQNDFDRLNAAGLL